MAQINKPNEYFNTVLYSGNSSTQSITGVNFQPDFVWIKKRSATAYHYLMDSIRGTGKQLYSNVTNAEETNANALTSYDSDGFSLGSEGDVNATSTTYVGWNWLAGGTASSNTNGDITSTVSANTDSGFSIVSYTGTGSAATVGHGLGSVPKMMIIKNRDSVEEWGVYHVANGNTHVQYLNTTGAKSDDAGFWNDTTPTSSVFTVGNSTRVNQNGSAMIAYCFAEKQGFSKFGSYIGNGNNDGTFIYTGFKPAFVMNKISSGIDNWLISDNKRLGYNEKNQQLFPNLNNAEQTNVRYDLYSNGFKVVNNNGEINTSGATYIYMAFAENPLVGTNNIPATAR